MESVKDTFYYMYLSHKEGVEYTLSEDAQSEYDRMVDSYAELLDEKYQMHLDEDENKENVNDMDIACTQTNLCMSTSKDTIHVLRLAAAIHILSEFLKATLMKVLDSNWKAEDVISLACLRRARLLYSCLARQKSIFAQSVQSINQVDCVRLKKVTSFRTRVTRAVVLSRGPVITIYGSYKENSMDL
ncbi:uncharacterized protein LOC134229502 [Saccostrea cucullata]|uniref:uncharacterized protein LOC134229502 n=1 Tax=Saccostrea cuccullata TaxID=36930 RepID=UPI002ED42688